MRRQAARRAGQGRNNEGIEDTDKREDNEDQLVTGQELEGSEEEAAAGDTNHDVIVVINIE